ncbi:MAG: hypothetical protein A2W80_04855 [Candidatus Riflebacteria bacterium GWC2_50_8]|nr:MAG: hypothetical protein A2W80_04855 [Candidatus Riflebacteria bacterium GWC2_50_8]
MRKVFLLLMMILTIFLPPVSVYMAFKSAENLQLNENRNALFARVSSQLQQLDRSMDPSELLIREITRIREILTASPALLEKSIADGSLERLLNEKIPRVVSEIEFPVQIDCLIRPLHDPANYKLISYGDNLGLSLFSRKAIEVSANDISIIGTIDRFKEQGQHIDFARFNSSATQRTGMMIQKLQPLMTNCINELYAGNINKFVLRDNGMCLLLSLENIRKQLLIFILAETNDMTLHKAIMQKMRAPEQTDFGVGTVLDNLENPVFSEYFAGHPELKKQLSRRLGLSNENPVHLKLADHEIIINAHDKRKGGRLFAAIPNLKANTQEKKSQHLLIVTLFLFSCMAFKILVEKIIFDRGPDLSIKVLLPATFLFLVIQPVFAAASLFVDFFDSSYANEKSRASEKLTSDLRNIDLATRDKFRNILNLARGYDSIEKISAFSSTEYKDNEYELCLALLNNVKKEHGVELFSSLWFSTSDRPFAGAIWNPRDRIYEQVKFDDPVTQYFHQRFLEILDETLEHRTVRNHESSRKLDKEIKSEFSRDFFLKILGSESFYRFRQNSSILLGLNTKFKKSVAVANPVSFRGKPFAYTVWNVTDNRHSIAAHLLTLDPLAPRLAFEGTEHKVACYHFDREQVVASQPELFRIGLLAHLSRTRINSRIEQQQNTIISEAFPSNYSHFTITGSEILKSYQLFCRELAARNILNLSAILLTGLILAFAGALYFTAPLRELTRAAYGIAGGDFSCRITRNHPDEFAAIGNAFNRMATGLDEGQRLKSFVSDSVRREVASADESEISERACTRQATIIFSAICGFAEFQKTHKAGEVFELLQQHLQAADLAVREFGGEIDKMIEDKIMIVFEHDEPSPEISGLAINFADSISALMKKNTGKAVGIGVNTGTTVAGVMGAVNARLSRTVVGDPVNLAARLASLATQRPEGGIVASQQILAGLPESFKADKLPINKVKGKTQAVEAYLLQKTDVSEQIS